MNRTSKAYGLSLVMMVSLAGGCGSNAEAPLEGEPAATETVAPETSTETSEESQGQALGPPVCGPNQLAAKMNEFCNRFKPSKWDILFGIVMPGYGISKVALWSSCKGVANSGYLIDAMVKDCCVAHDACYNRGGNQSCKNTCDSNMLKCNIGKLAPYPYGVNMATHIAAAATLGGFGTFNYTDDATCGAAALVSGVRKGRPLVTPVSSGGN